MLAKVVHNVFVLVPLLAQPFIVLNGLDIAHVFGAHAIPCHCLGNTLHNFKKF